MEQGFCSKNLKHFILSLQQEENSIENLLDLISLNISCVADELLLGELNICFKQKAFPYNLKDFIVSKQCYSCGKELSLFCYEKTFNCGKDCYVTFTANPRKQIVWSEEDTSNLDFLFSFISIFFTRCNLNENLLQNQKKDLATGLLNVEGFKDYLLQLQEQKKLFEYTAICSDIKNFRSINKFAPGSDADKLLKEYFLLLKDFIGSNGLLARYGWDSFIALVKDDFVEAYLERLANTVISSVQLKARSGVYDITEKSLASDVVSNAFLALSEAKKSLIHDVLFFTPEFLEKSVQTKKIAYQVHNALENKEFLVYYQPKIRLNTNVLCGCEALSRWQRDKLVFPSEFIPVLEDEGSIRSLDLYMLDSVCHDIRKWLDDGIDVVRVSTNFSRVNLADSSLEDSIFSILKEHNVDGKYLELELIDLADFRNFERLVSFINKMKSLGINIALDNFGAGRTSINILRDLKVNTIKLDKSLVDSISSSAQSLSDNVVCQAIIKLAKELNIDVIAEGVESLYQADYLKNLGCSMAQGFLFDRPVPSKDFEELLLGTRVYSF